MLAFVAASALLSAPALAVAVIRALVSGTAVRYAHASHPERRVDAGIERGVPDGGLIGDRPRHAEGGPWVGRAIW